MDKNLFLRTLKDIMNKTLIVATFGMTPSVNELYGNIEPGTSKWKPNGGRILKKEFRDLKETIIDGLYNGFFLPGGVDTIHYIDKRYINKIQELYDKAAFQEVQEPLDHLFSLEIEVVFPANKNGKKKKADGDNKVKFIQDCIAKRLGVDDSHFAKAFITTIHSSDPQEPAHVDIVVKHLKHQPTKGNLLQQALHELHFEKMTEKDIEELPDEINPLD